MKVDADANLEWERRLLAGEHSELARIRQLAQNEFMGFGELWGSSVGTDRAWLVKIGPELPQPHLRPLRFEHDFGDCWLFSRNTQVLPLYNIGSDTLEDLEATETLHFHIEFPDSRILPGDTSLAVVVFEPQWDRDFHSYLYISSNDSESPLIVWVTGSGIEIVMEAQPPSLLFGTVDNDTTVVRDLTLVNTGDAALSIDNYSLNPPFFIDFPLPHSLDPGDSVSFQVEMTADTTGTFLEELVFDYHGSYGPLIVHLTGARVQSSDAAEAPLPLEFELQLSYPNPFNPATTIPFALPRDTKVIINIFDISGRLIDTLVDSYYPAGYHNVTFDAAGLPSGIYFARLTAGEFTQTQKLVLLK
jgi:hypothetical protein